MTQYVVYDVFSDRQFGGNPLAVVPDARSLPEDALQRIAREFNYSESTFVFPPEDAASTAKVRIFTPTQEIPFAGHPTIGTAIALSALGLGGPDMILELGVGQIPCHVEAGQARFETRVPLQTWDGITPDIVASSIGQSVDCVRTDRHAPIIASVGLPFAIAELRDREALAAAEANIHAFKSFEAVWPAESHYDLLVYVREGNNIQARMFAPLDGIPEDPATGSAAAALAALLGRQEGASNSFAITQGEDMGRPSTINASVEVEEGKPVGVTIAGSAVKIMQGTLAL
ncbi:MAG: PhzF family phenazine biosynthesis protein [Boseongicola sp.]